MRKLFLLFCLLPSFALAQISVAPIQSTLKTQSFTANLAQNAGTYDLATASADVVIQSITTFVATAPTGLTSVTMQSSNTTSDVVLASTLLAVMTGGKNLTPVSLPFLLPSTKKIQYTIVGNGTGSGALTVVVEYESPSGGVLS